MATVEEQIEALRGHPNTARGLLEVDIPEVTKFGGVRRQGKVRDIFDVEGELFIVTTDRKSVFDGIVATAPNVGKVLNELSGFWFNSTRHLVVNHLEDIPHPNVMVARRADTVARVEMVYRRYMADSSSSTSIAQNYLRLGRREIYGIQFPEGLKPNQAFPESLGRNGIILTPTTKSTSGHDLELTHEEARRIFEDDLGPGSWDQAVESGYQVYDFISGHLATRDLLFVDTKTEWGVRNGYLMVVDELGTQDSSRLWRASTYQERLDQGQPPQSYDKEQLRKALAQLGYKGEGEVPTIPVDAIDRLSASYISSFVEMTGTNLSQAPSDPDLIRRTILEYLGID